VKAHRVLRRRGSHIFLDNWLTDGGEVLSLTPRSPFTPGRFLALISVRGLVDPGAIVRLEGLGKLKKIHLIGTRTCDLPVCSIVPQLTTLLRRTSLFFQQALQTVYLHRITYQNMSVFTATAVRTSDLHCTLTIVTLRYAGVKTWLWYWRKNTNWGRLRKNVEENVWI
jgi:hypothetical protein